MLHDNKIQDKKALINKLTEPSKEVRKVISDLKSEIMILGAGGKMGPTLAEMIVRANGKVIGVDLFPDESLKKYLDSIGVYTITCDLFDSEPLNQLPDAENIFILVGTKFGATGNEPFIWAMNTFLPAKILERYPRSNFVYLSSGNVYQFKHVNTKGANEQDEIGPVGEYAMSRLAGERILSYLSQRNQIPGCLIRLFYATELRYGVIHDIAHKIKNKQPINLEMGHFNQIWQGDACQYLIRCLSLAEIPAQIMNMTGPEILSVKEVANKLGKLMGIEPKFEGNESPNALLGDSSKLFRHFGKPSISADQIINWVAHWVMQGRDSLGKPTKFEKRNGKF